MNAIITAKAVAAAARCPWHDTGKTGASSIAVLTFNWAIVTRLTELCTLEQAGWVDPQLHPYAPVQIVKRGQYRDLGITVIVPPMGASPVSCVIEDLVACGIKAVFLLCAAWSLGPPVRFGELMVPSFSMGPDGTSIHYGNTQGRVDADAGVVDSLSRAIGDLGAVGHVGGNATCEALYRITPQMVDEFRRQGCLCMENGEANTLLSIGKALGIVTGVLFQPYIDLSVGWNPSRLDARYDEACRLQAEVVLAAALELRHEGRFERS